MVDPSLFWLFLAGALILNITPGPDMAFTLASATRGGVKTGLAAAAGVGAGCVGWAVFTAAGLAALLAASAQAMTVIKFVGGAYLLYLAWRTFAARRELKEGTGAASLGAAFRSGALTNLFNPKVGLFYLAFLPSFTNAEIGPVWLQILTLGVVFSFTGSLVLAGVAFAAGSLRERLARSEKLRVRLNTVAATAFAALGLRLVLAPAE
ncbi:MAG TPA: LysE family translocator [Amphiplicatus sp.]|nr:LysE family translocator [Amphiplicatus sp.]